MNLLTRTQADPSVIETLFAGLVFASSVTIRPANANRTNAPDILTRMETGEAFSVGFLSDENLPAPDHWSGN